MNSLFTIGVTFFFLSPSVIKAQCGVERWNVKVLNDADTSSINWLPVVSTVEEQDRLPKEKVNPSTPRLPSEKTIYQIEGYITFFKRESDQDVHLIFVGKDSSMVIEIPSPDCPDVQTTSRGPIFAKERAWVSSNLGIATTKFKPVNPRMHVMVTGLGFQDFQHGQRGIGANAREIHPVLSIIEIR